MKLLTISIAAYNVEKYLEKALTSMVCSPTAMEKLEVIIEDDGSTDGTLSIAKKYEKLYPDVYRAIHKENGGYGSTINNSIVLAQGKYFKQLDGDDWFDTENISTVPLELYSVGILFGAGCCIWLYAPCEKKKPSEVFRGLPSDSWKVYRWLGRSHY